MVEGNHVVYRISAPSLEEKEEWMKSIRCRQSTARGVGVRVGTHCVPTVHALGGLSVTRPLWLRACALRVPVD